MVRGIESSSSTRKKREVVNGAVVANIEVKALCDYSIFKFHEEEADGTPLDAFDHALIYFKHIFNQVCSKYTSLVSCCFEMLYKRDRFGMSGKL